MLSPLAGTWNGRLRGTSWKPGFDYFGYHDVVLNLHVRPARLADEQELARLRHALWPEGSLLEHQGEVRAIVGGHPPGTLPLAIVVAESDDHTLVGFLEVGLRSHAEGCEPSRAVAYIEGWYVAEGCRRQGVGSQLMAAAEAWARAHGCREMASDSHIDYRVSQRVHAALGFDEVERSVNYRKVL